MQDFFKKIYSNYKSKDIWELFVSINTKNKMLMCLFNLSSCKSNSFFSI